MLPPTVGGAQGAPPSIHRDLHYTSAIDGKPVGASEVTVEPDRDGRVTPHSRTRIDIKSMLFSCRYSSTVRETWSGDRLISVEAETVEDGETSRTKVTLLPPV